MRLTRCQCQLLHLPGSSSGGPERIAVLLVQLDTDAGFARRRNCLHRSGKRTGLAAVANDDIAPLLTGEDPLDHERLAAKAYCACKRSADAVWFAMRIRHSTSGGAGDLKEKPPTYLSTNFWAAPVNRHPRLSATRVGRTGNRNRSWTRPGRCSTEDSWG